jgi:hypothetical protein
MTTEDKTQFHLERVKTLVEQNAILKSTFIRTTRRSNRGEASYRAIFNALIKHDKAFMAQYLSV